MNSSFDSNNNNVFFKNSSTPSTNGQSFRIDSILDSNQYKTDNVYILGGIKMRTSTKNKFNAKENGTFHKALTDANAAKTYYRTKAVGIVEGGGKPIVDDSIYVYGLRHTSEDHSIPATIEPVVRVDRWGWLLSEVNLFNETNGKFDTDFAGDHYINLSKNMGLKFAKAVMLHESEILGRELSKGIIKSTRKK